MKSTRRQIITDQTVQGELLFRAILYWLFCVTTVLFSIVGWAMWCQPERSLFRILAECLPASAPVLVGAVILLPLILIDVLRVSNRFVGPIRQIRYVLKQLSKGEPTRAVFLRRDDFWQDMAHYTNVIAEELEQHRNLQVANAVPPKDADSTVSSEPDSASGKVESLESVPLHS